MENDTFDGNEQFHCIKDLKQLKSGQKVFIGDQPNARNCRSLLPARIEHNFPSQWHSKYSRGYISLTGNGEKTYFDIASETIVGKAAYFFRPTERIEGIYIEKCIKDQKVAEAVRALVAEGVKQYHAKNYCGAVKRFESAITLDPANVEAQSRMAHALTKLGLYKESSESIKAGLSMGYDRDRWSLLYDDLGLCKSSLGDPEGAIVCFALSLGFSRRNVKALVHRAISYERQAQYELALTDLFVALRLRPCYPPALRVKQRLERRGWGIHAAIA
jgi:tetratricopeptide (TPR) repeat protein